MGGSPSGHGIAVYGAGAVGRALSSILSCPLYRRGSIGRHKPKYALVCWPAHALGEDSLLYQEFPELSGVEVTTLCNGVWVPPANGSMGVAYIRARPDGSYTGAARWRVASPSLAGGMRAAGADVTATRHGGHLAYVWGKAAYLIPLALACEDTGRTAKGCAGGPEHSKYLDHILCVSRKEIGPCMDTQIKRINWLLGRLPVGWVPSPSRSERDYFRRKLGI